MNLQDFNNNLLIKLYKPGISLKGYSVGGFTAVKFMMEINSVHSCVRICLLCQCTNFKIMIQIKMMIQKKVNHSWYDNQFKIT